MTGNAHRPIGLAQLSLLNTAPPELVGVAARAGFDFVGVRVRPVTPSERRYELQPGSPMLRERWPGSRTRASAYGTSNSCFLTEATSATRGCG